jgi:hypothetical protein
MIAVAAMDRRPPGSQNALSALLFLLGGAACGGTSAGEPPPVGGASAVPAASPGCDLASRDFQQSSPGPCGLSTWHFTPKGDGSYDARETGCANATGTARSDGSTVTVDFTYPGGAGKYTWPLDAQCQGTTGRVIWSSGPLAGKDAESTLAPVAR